MLAEALAARGVSTARVDKRGMFGSAAAGDPNAASVRGYVGRHPLWVRTLAVERRPVYLGARPQRGCADA
jgi:hypothetical protein